MTSKQPVSNFLPQIGYLGTLLIKQGDAHSSSLDYAGGDQSNQLRVLDSFKRSHTTSKWQLSALRLKSDSAVSVAESKVQNSLWFHHCSHRTSLIVSLRSLKTGSGW